MRKTACVVFLGLLLAACAQPTPAPEAPPALPQLRTTDVNGTVVPIQERFQLLGTAERELDGCVTSRISPAFGGDRRARRECVDPRFPAAAR